MRLPKPRRGNAYELAVRAQRFDCGASNVAHPAAEPADHLVKHVGDRALVGNATLDPLGNKLARRHLSLLEVTVSAPVLHRPNAAHPTDHFEPPPFQEERLPRAFLRT